MSLFKFDFDIQSLIDNRELIFEFEDLSIESDVVINDKSINDYDSIVYGYINDKCFMIHSNIELDVYDICINDTDYDDSDVLLVYLMHLEMIPYKKK